MLDARIEHAAIAVCQVIYPEAWRAGKQWETFPPSTQQTMRHAARAALLQHDGQRAAIDGETRHLVGVIADKIEDGSLFCAAKQLKDAVAAVGDEAELAEVGWPQVG